MRRALAVLAITAAATPFGAARAGGAPTPMCLVPTVLDRMAAELGGNPYYSRLDPGLVFETPTADPRTVRCAVCLSVVHSGAGRPGKPPAARCGAARFFTVRALRNGFVLDAPR